MQGNLFKIQGILFIIFYLIVNFIIEKNIFTNIADWGMIYLRPSTF